MVIRQFGLIGYSGGAHAPPSHQPCPSFTSSRTQRAVQPVAYNTGPPPGGHACVHPRSPSVSLFFRHPLAGWPSHGTPIPTPTPCEWNAIFSFPLWATHRALVAHCQPPPPPSPVPHVSHPMYLCFPRMMGYPLRTGTHPDSTPRLSATTPGHGVWGNHFCDVHFVALFTTLHRPAAAVTPACQPADP